MKSTFYIEYYGKQIDESTLIKKAKAIWTSNGNKAADLKSIKLFVKPEEDMVYYVFNEEVTGGFPVE